MATKLAVFDFDKTLIDGDSDAAVISMLSERQPPPEWEGGHVDWTPYMNEIFGLVHAAGFSKEDILSRVGGLRAVPGARQLVTRLAEDGWHVLLITDSNSVFVQHWLKVNGLEDKVRCVLTNPAHWARGRLAVRPHALRQPCARCPPNLCKRRALERYRRGRAPYTRLLYVGDGRNDVCPIGSLGAEDVACPRAGYPCAAMLSAAPPAARVLSWTDHWDILRALYPEIGLHIS